MAERLKLRDYEHTEEYQQMECSRDRYDPQFLVEIAHQFL